MQRLHSYQILCIYVYCFPFVVNSLVIVSTSAKPREHVCIIAILPVLIHYILCSCLLSNQCLFFFFALLYIYRTSLFLHICCVKIFTMQANIILVQYSLVTMFFTFLHVCFLFQRFITYILFVISSFYTTLIQYMNGCHTICITILLHVSNFYIFPKYCHRASRLSSDCSLFHGFSCFVRLIFDNG